jgi:hypothetical protein
MTFPLVPHGLATKEQRRRVLTSTDVKRLVNGEWRALWDEKLGHVEPVDLTFIWKPRLGLATETLHGWWHGHTEGVALRRVEDRPMINPALDLPAHYASSYDFWVEATGEPLECKHLNARNSLRPAAESYMPQLQWELLCSGASSLRFSCIFGNEDPQWGRIDRDEEYITRLRQQADAFWDMVVSEIPPQEEIEPDAELVKAARSVPINGLKDYDYSLNNEWCVLAAEYAQLKPQADKCAIVNKALKELVPADAATVTGAGVKISRTKKGLTLTIKGEELDA